jgi:hypothetical protein
VRVSLNCNIPTHTRDKSYKKIDGTVLIVTIVFREDFLLNLLRVKSICYLWQFTEYLCVFQSNVIQAYPYDKLSKLFSRYFNDIFFLY